MIRTLGPAMRAGCLKVFMLCSLSGSLILLKAQENAFPVLRGLYLGQKPPGDTAEVFAKNIISTPLYEHSAPAFSPDGNTVLWTVLDRGKPARMFEMNNIDGTWTKPHLASFADSGNDDFYPFFSVDGKELLFSSRRPLPTGAPVGDLRLWMVERIQNAWGRTLPLDWPVSRGFEYAHAVSAKGTLVFSAREIINEKPTWKIYSSNRINGRYTQPIPLDSSINSGAYVDGPYISPDEQFLIFESDRPGGLGSMDLYICFKGKDGKWSAPKNMGKKVNSEFAERFAGISPDAKYLFFGSNRNSELPDIYWIDAGFISSLKQ